MDSQRLNSASQKKNLVESNNRANLQGASGEAQSTQEGKSPGKQTATILPYTQVPHMLIDHYMKNLSSIEFCVLLLILRKTKGFQKKNDKIALTQFEEFTGRSRPTIRASLEKLENEQLIVRLRRGSGHDTSIFAINEAFLLEQYEKYYKANGGKKISPIGEETFPPREINLPPGGKENYPQKKTFKESPKEKVIFLAKKDSQSTKLLQEQLKNPEAKPKLCQDFRKYWEAIYQQKLGLPYEFDKSEIKRIKDLVIRYEDDYQRLQVIAEFFVEHFEIIPGHTYLTPRLAGLYWFHDAIIVCMESYFGISRDSSRGKPQPKRSRPISF